MFRRDPFLNDEHREPPYRGQTVPLSRFTWASPAIDVVLLLIVLLSYLLLLPEAPHGDGVRWARSIETHHIEVNPNYLLMEPIAVAVYSAWETIGLPREGTQFQKYLDVLMAIVSLFLLTRCLLALSVPPMTRRLCVVLMAFSYNFFSLATSDHIKLITAPFLMATLLYLIHYLTTNRPRTLMWAGLFLGLSICTLVNALTWFAMLVPVLFMISGPSFVARFRVAATFGLFVIAPALLLLSTFYLLSAPQQSFLSWLTSYGGKEAAKDVGFGGLNWLTVGRALSAVIKNFAFSADLGPIVKAAVTGTSLPPVSGAFVLLNVVTFLAVSWLLVRVAWWVMSKRQRLTTVEVNLTLVMAAAVIGYFMFGLVWNTSEEEFWFQITAPVIIVAAMFLKDRPTMSIDTVAVTVVTMLVMSNTLLTFAIPRHAYPYFKYVDTLSSTLGTTHLLIYDGSDPVNLLVYGMKSKGSVHTMGIYPLLEQHEFDLHKTLSSLERETQQTREHGGKVYVLDIFSPQSTSHPWTLMHERFKIEKEDIIRFLNKQGAYQSTELVGRLAWVLE